MAFSSASLMQSAKVAGVCLSRSLALSFGQRGPRCARWQNAVGSPGYGQVDMAVEGSKTSLCQASVTGWRAGQSRAGVA